MSLNGLAQLCDDLWSQRDPARSTCSHSNTFEYSSVAPVRNRRDIHIEEFCRSQRRIAPISSLSAGTEPRLIGTVERNVVGSTNPVDLARRETASQPCTKSLMIELLGNVRCGARRARFTTPTNDQRIIPPNITPGLRPGTIPFPT